MLFEGEDFYVDMVKDEDIDKIVEVYNSNENFLINHIGEKYITPQWVTKEISTMREIGFYSCKIVQKGSANIVGIIDFKVGEEAYLSLLMLHGEYKHKGLGNKVFLALERYLQALDSKDIRIDVVGNYDDTVLDFWIRNGFNKDDDVTLMWGDKILPAIIMRKTL